MNRKVLLIEPNYKNKYPPISIPKNLEVKITIEPKAMWEQKTIVLVLRKNGFAGIYLTLPKSNIITIHSGTKKK